MAAERLRIDDLARETGVTVDTIRYYQREGLLPPAEREGRHRIYGPQHVRRLGRIKELQSRRFSIAAIRAMLSGDEGRLEGIFADEGEGFRYTHDELVERSGASEELIGLLQDAGILRDPLEFGRTAYDGDDLDMLRGLVRLEEVGMPPKAIRTIGQIYAEGIEATQRRVVDVFADGGPIEWEPGELDRFRETAAREADAVLPAIRRLVDYTHHRTIQRLTLDAVARGMLPDPRVRGASAPEADPDADPDASP